MTNRPDGQRYPVPDGPWTHEPDRVEFEHLGFPCIINRGNMGNWCGYVGVPPGHPWHGKDSGDIDARAHGGINYAHPCQGEICHVPKAGEPDDVYWFGFDCAHSGDLVPGMVLLRSPEWTAIMRGTYKDQNYVTDETKRLAAQAARALTKGE